MDDLIESVIDELIQEPTILVEEYSSENNSIRQDALALDESTEDSSGKNSIKIIEHTKPKPPERNTVKKFTLVGEGCCSQTHLWNNRSSEMVTAVQSYTRSPEEEIPIDSVFEPSDAVKTTRLLDMFDDIVPYEETFYDDEELRREPSLFRI